MPLDRASSHFTNATDSSPASCHSSKRIQLVDEIRSRGVDFFRVAWKHDLEGIVAKWKDGTYTKGPRRHTPPVPWRGHSSRSSGRHADADVYAVEPRDIAPVCGNQVQSNRPRLSSPPNSTTRRMLGSGVYEADKAAVVTLLPGPPMSVTTT